MLEARALLGQRRHMVWEGSTAVGGGEDSRCRHWWWGGQPLPPLVVGEHRRREPGAVSVGQAAPHVGEGASALPPVGEEAPAWPLVGEEAMQNDAVARGATAAALSHRFLESSACEERESK